MQVGSPKLRPSAPAPVVGVAARKGFLWPDEFDISRLGVVYHVRWIRVRWKPFYFRAFLGFSDQEIAAGLGVTAGTVRYRVGRGLRHLGGYIES